jgi:glycine/D-amino acid oxidase-like deaminating enzyme
MSDVFDLAVIGGGLPGALAATRLKLLKPELSIILIEKERHWGGRIRNSRVEEGIWSVGLDFISAPMIDFWDKLIASAGFEQDLSNFKLGELRQAGVLAGGKISEFSFGEMFTSKAAGKIGGPSAKREWADLEKLLEEIESARDSEKPFAKYWSGSRKSGSAVVLETLIPVWGVPDLWSAQAQVVQRKVVGAQQGKWQFGDWVQALEMTLSKVQQQGLQTKMGCRVISSSYLDDTWHLDTEAGEINAKSLLVAESPWEIETWLEKKQIPSPVLSVASKAKPASILALSDYLPSKPEGDIPQVTFVPSEGVQVIYDGDREVCYRITLDHEITFETPTVAKAVRSLKRAKKKFLTTIGVNESKEGPLVLLPVGWGLSWSSQDYKWTSKLGDYKFQSAHLAFCGDSYGESKDGDENIVNSILSACEAIVTKE